MFEALGCGKPFVGTNVGGIPEIIISEDFGLLCKPANPKDLTEKILIAIDKKWEYKKIMKYADQFTWNNISKVTIKAYEKVLINK
jgi:glycosyltransferase involved in cell wall biosynthesis